MVLFQAGIAVSLTYVLMLKSLLRHSPLYGDSLTCRNLIQVLFINPVNLMRHRLWFLCGRGNDGLYILPLSGTCGFGICISVNWDLQKVASPIASRYFIPAVTNKNVIRASTHKV